MQERKIGSLLTYLNVSLSALIHIFLVPIYLYFLGTSEFGIYQLVGSLIAYLSLLDFGLTTATTRFYTVAKSHDDSIAQQNIVGFSLIIYMLLAGILLSLGFFVYQNITYFFDSSLTDFEIISLRKVFVLLLFNIAVTLPGNIFIAILNSHEKFILLRSLQIGQSVLRPLTVIFFLFFSPYAATVAFVQTAYNCIAITIRAYYCFAKLHVQLSFRHVIDIPLQPFAVLAFSTFLVFITDLIFWRTNQIVLGVMDGAVAVAVYSVAATLYMAYLPFSTSISSVFLPKITTMVARNCSVTELSDLFNRVGRLQYVVLLLVLIGFISLGKEFIVLWVGEEFTEAFYIALIIMLPFTIDLIQNTGLSIMQAQNGYMYRAKVYLLVGFLNIALVVPFAHLWGGIGCATATAIAMFLGNGVIMNYHYWKHLGLNIPFFWKEIGHITLVALPTLGVAWGCNYVWESYAVPSFLYKISFITVCYCITMYTFAMNSYEKKMIKGLVTLLQQVIQNLIRRSLRKQKKFS